MKNNICTQSASYEGEDGIFAVCDGMGGHSAGEVASLNAVRWLNDCYEQLLCAQEDELGEYIARLNEEIVDYSARYANCHNMGATLSALVITKNKICSINAGDSRIYRFDGKSVTQWSTDHTEGQRLFDLGLLDEDELKAFPSRKMLYKYLGRKGSLCADVAHAVYNRGDIFLLCSDGLTDALCNEEIADVITQCDNVSQMGQTLLDKALAKGDVCADNVTLLLIEIL
ncbi:MAG: serine/threonine-protein phosphatase [Clostridia bacterium]|nr:serine/threonine-protein phosphatase [Clostridia bacterium]